MTFRAMSQANGRKGAQREYLVRAGALDGYEALTRELGLDPKALLTKSGIDPRSLENADTLISYRAFLRALDAARVASGTL